MLNRKSGFNDNFFFDRSDFFNRRRCCLNRYALCRLGLTRRILRQGFAGQHHKIFTRRP